MKYKKATLIKKCYIIKKKVNIKNVLVIEIYDTQVNTYCFLFKTIQKVFKEHLFSEV